MSFGEAFRLAMATLWANRLRSILTVVGNVVAVLSVVMVVSVIQGLDLFVSRQVRQSGSDVFTLTKIGLVMDYESWLRASARPDLTIEDADDLRLAMTTAEAVSARVDNRVKISRGGRSAGSIWVSGVGDGYALMSDLPLQSGRHLGQLDVQGRAPSVVIGYGVQQALFPQEDPVGSEIRIDRQRYSVVGVVAKRGAKAGESVDNQLWIPVTSFAKQFGSRRSVDIQVKGRPDVPLDEAKEEAALILKIRQGKNPWERPDFDVMTDEQLYSLYQNATRGIFGLLVGVVSLSLVVGGIVIMNIMLVAVTERTREIGIRKAVGARRIDITRQFLVESVALAAIGGVLGVLLGVAGALFVGNVTPIPAKVEPWSMLVGLLLSSSVGLFFGIYPAHRASLLAPITALRHES